MCIQKEARNNTTTEHEQKTQHFVASTRPCASGAPECYSAEERKTWSLNL